MKKNLIDKFFRLLISEPEIKHYGIVGGKLGAACFILGYSELRQDIRARENGERLLQDCIMNINPQAPGLLNGKWGIIPAVRFLIEKGIINISDNVMKLIENIRDEEFFIYGCVPVKIYFEDPILTDVLILRDMHDIATDPIKKLGYRERLISYVEECEYLLTESYPSIYSPDMLTSSQLHSMAWFINYAFKEQLYPFKSLLLSEKIKDFIVDKPINENIHDRLMRNFVNGEPINRLPFPSCKEDKIRFLNEAGYYSWLYKEGTILSDLMGPDEENLLCAMLESGALKWEDIAGIALGVLTDSNLKTNLAELSTYKTAFNSEDKQYKISPIEKNERQEVLNDKISTSEDLTFCIPVRIDSRERLRNLNAVLNFYLENTSARFIILEADSNRRLRLPDNQRIKYIFIEDNNMIFHRTHYINTMLRECTTRYAAVWDTDVVVPIKQIDDALRLFSESEAVMVYPYAGMLWAIMEFMSNRFSETLDINILSNFPQNTFLMCAYHSVGGGFIVDKDLYRKFGWENENFTGWGPEDVERWKRLEILGFKPLRTNGSMYHLNHSRGINSKLKDPETALKTRTELAKICSMMPNTLADYIKCWNWIN